MRPGLDRDCATTADSSSVSINLIPVYHRHLLPAVICQIVNVWRHCRQYAPGGGGGYVRVRVLSDLDHSRLCAAVAGCGFTETGFMTSVQGNAQGGLLTWQRPLGCRLYIERGLMKINRSSDAAVGLAGGAQ